MARIISAPLVGGVAPGPTPGVTAAILVAEAMPYHLYDDQRRHLAMSDSLEDIQAVALDTFLDSAVPHGYIRWADGSGGTKEVQITAASLAEVMRPQAAAHYAGTAGGETHPSGPRLSGRQLAIRLTMTAVALVLVYLAAEVAAILLQDPLLERLFLL